MHDPRPAPPADDARRSPAPSADRPLIADAPRVAFCLRDRSGRILAARDADRPFYAASTIKLHVAAAVLKAADAGRLDLDATVPASPTSRAADGGTITLAGDHLDPTHPGEGTPITIGELVERMIDRSSNEATNTLIDLVGLPAVARVIEELVLGGTRVERRIGDAAALARGRTNETTAADLTATMLALTTGRLAGPDGTERALAALRGQRIRVIADALRTGVDVGSKSGEIEGIRHDVAFLGTPGSGDARVLAVMTSGMAAPAADEAIRALTAALVPDLVR